MKKQKPEFFYDSKKIKPNLFLKKVSLNDRIMFLNLYHEYKFNEKKEVFEILFCCDENSKLCKEKHIINGKLKKEYICDTSISPNMDEVYKYLLSGKSR